MKSWSTLSFSSSRPQCARWKPGCEEMVDIVDCQTWPAGEVGSSIWAPGVRGMVANSVTGAIVMWWVCCRN